MSIIPDGVYRITKPNDQAATVFAANAPPDPTRRIFLLPKTMGKEQEWLVKNLTNGNVTIQNVVTKEYLGFPEKRQNELCEQTSEAVEWRLQLSAEKGKLHVVVPGGPVGEYELALDISPLLIYPPLIALGTLRVTDVGQAWGFVRKA